MTRLVKNTNNIKQKSIKQKNLFEILNTIERNKNKSKETGFFNKLKEKSLDLDNLIGGTTESSDLTSQFTKSAMGSMLGNQSGESSKDLTSQFSKSAMDSMVGNKSGKSSDNLTSQLTKSAMGSMLGNKSGESSDNLTSQLTKSAIDSMVKGKSSDNLTSQLTKSAMGSMLGNKSGESSNNLTSQLTKSAMDSMAKGKSSDDLTSQLTKSAMGSMLGNKSGESGDNLTSQLSKSAMSSMLGNKSGESGDNLTSQLTKSAMGSVLGNKSVDDLTTQKSPSLFSFIGKENNVSKEKNIPKEEKPKGFWGSIKAFFRTDYFYFIKNYLFFLVLFSICFYLLLFINDTSKIKSELVITKVFFYLIIIFIFMIMADILETPLEYQNKLLMIIMFSLLLVYLMGFVVDHYYKKDNFYTRILKIFLASLIVYVITLIIIHYTLVKYDTNKLNQIYSNFSYGISKNIYFLIFIFIYLLFYSNIFYLLNLWNSKISEILGTSLLGLLLILFIFIFIIFIILKMKIITKIQILNTFIALSSIAVFLAVVYGNIFMSSLNTICKEKVDPKDVDQEERIGVLLMICIFIILWYDDSRNWHALGSLLFIFVTVFGLYCFLYYSTTHPSLGTLSIWFFIEWLIIIFYRKQNSKNAIHFSFMQI